MRRLRGGVAGLLTVLVFGLLVAAMRPSGEGPQARQPGPAKPRPVGKPVAMPADLAGREITLGLKDEKPTPWAGEIRVSDGKLLEVEWIRGCHKARGPLNKLTGRATQ